MPFHTSWYLENRVIYVQVIGIITPPELKPFNDEMVRLIESSDYPLVHCIADFRQAERMPSIVVLGRTFKFPSHPQFGWTGFFGFPNKLLTITLTVLPQLLKARFRHLSNADEAIVFINQMDSTLPDLMPYKDHIAAVDALVTK